MNLIPLFYLLVIKKLVIENLKEFWINVYKLFLDLI